MQGSSIRRRPLCRFGILRVSVSLRTETGWFPGNRLGLISGSHGFVTTLLSKFRESAIPKLLELGRYLYHVNRAEYAEFLTKPPLILFSVYARDGRPSEFAYLQFGAVEESGLIKVTSRYVLCAPLCKSDPVILPTGPERFDQETIKATVKKLGFVKGLAELIRNQAIAHPSVVGGETSIIRVTRHGKLKWLRRGGCFP